METESRTLNGDISRFNIIGLNMFLNTDIFKPIEQRNDLDLQNHPQPVNSLLIVDSLVGDKTAVDGSCKFKETIEIKSVESTESAVVNIDSSAMRYKKLKKIQLSQKCSIKKKKYPCPVCRKNCPTSCARKQHVNKHFGKQLNFCLYCGKIFVHKQQFFLHYFIHCTKIKTVKNSTPQTENTSDLFLELVRIEQCYTCKFCSENFSDKHDLELHYYCDHPIEQTHDLDRVINTRKCSYCDETFTNLKRLKNHVVSHLKPFRCDICATNFLTEHSLKAHQSRHDTSYKCQICYRKFDLIVGLKKHLNTHIGAAPFGCAVCKKVYKKKFPFKLHLLGHHKQQAKLNVSIKKKTHRYQCQRCYKCFKTKDIFERHSKWCIEVECKFCRKVVYKQFLQKHLKTHVKLDCDVCGRQFVRKSSLQRHLRLEQRRDNGDILMKCQICEQHFFKKSSLSYHRLTHHKVVEIKSNDDNEVIKCETCFETFPTKNNLRTHIRDAHTIDVVIEKEDSKFAFKCDTCQKTFTKQRNYDLHLKKHEVHTCKICDKEIGVANVLVRHLNSHVGDNKPFDCAICSKKFEYKSDFQTHLLAEHKRVKEQLFECEICSFNYHNKTFLTKHKSKNHVPDFTNIDADASSIPEFLYNCETCRKGFNDEGKFQRHLKQHEYCETCFLCNVSFYNPSEFRSHFDDHANQPELVCGICSKSYSIKQKFKCHLLAEHRRLTKKALFTCEICSKGFHRQSSLNAHMNILHGSDPKIEFEPVAKCPVCQKPFIDTASFQTHFKRHNFLERCRICRKEFTVRAHLFKHLDEHLGGEPYRCVVCNRTFRSRRSLKEHLSLEQRKNNVVMRCEVCGYHFFHKMQFNKHVKYGHGANEELETEMPEFGHFMAGLYLQKND